MKIFTYVFIGFIIFLIGIENAQSRGGQLRHLYRPPSEIVGFKAYEIELASSYWSTTSFYDKDGNEDPLIEGNNYSKVDGDIFLRYGYGRKLEFRGFMRFRHHTSSEDGNKYKNSGVESYGASLLYSFIQKRKLSYALDLKIRKSAYENKNFSSGEVPENEFTLGDSGQEISIGGHIGHYRSSDHILHFSAFYNFPPNNLSNEITYDVNTTWIFSRLAIGAGVEGIYSLKEDGYVSEGRVRPSQSRGATYLYNSINREKIMPYLHMFLAFNKWRLGFKVAQVVEGVSTDKGGQYSLNILWSSKPISKDDVKISSFKEYHIEGSIIKVSSRGAFVRIDQGLSSDIEKGQRFDIYQQDFMGKNILVASGVVYNSGTDFSIIKITKKYKNTKIEKGFVARGY